MVELAASQPFQEIQQAVVHAIDLIAFPQLRGAAATTTRTSDRRAEVVGIPAGNKLLRLAFLTFVNSQIGKVL
jgi:hypothetical protein